MKVEAGTTRPRNSCRVAFSGRNLTVQEIQQDKLHLSFEDHEAGCVYHCTKKTRHINFKALRAALEQTEPENLKAVLQNIRGMWVLEVQVQIQYLQAFKEVFEFQEEPMDESRKKQLTELASSVKELNKLKEQALHLMGGMTKSGNYHCKGIQVDICFKKTLVTIDLNLCESRDQSVVIKFFYLKGSQKIKTNYFPSEPIIFFGGTGTLSFIAQNHHSTKGILQIEQLDAKDTYTLTCEALETKQPFNWRRFVKNSAIGGGIAMTGLGLSYLFQNIQNVGL